MRRSARNTRRDGLDNKIEFYVLTHFKRFWEVAQHNPRLEKQVNRALINRAILKMATRPFPLSTHGSLYVLGFAHRSHLQRTAPASGTTGGAIAADR